MNKSEFIAKIAEDAGLKKSDAEKFFDAFVCGVKDVVARGECRSSGSERLKRKSGAQKRASIR